jgi:diguanylate cyclase (GGDEF)-like protein/PAS domain S-box-containing protein
VDACGLTSQSVGGPVAYDDVVRRYRTLVEQLPLVVYVDALDVTSSNIFTSAQVEPLLGYTVAEWLTDPNLFARTLHMDDRDRVLAAHARTHATSEPLSIEYRLIAKDGHVVWVRDEAVVVFDDANLPLYLQGYLLDITPEREAQEQLRQMALYDTLTGLANRAFFHEQFEHTVSIRKGPEQQTAVLFLDLNDFKNVNDRWGHDVGDKVLATLGGRINGALRAGDLAARLGGDEFAVVIPLIEEPSEAVRVTERLLESISAPIDLEDMQLSVTASIGISIGSDVPTMLQEADAAMYRAKGHQDFGYAFFETTLDAAAVKRSRRLAELREAVDLGEFTLDYQPLIDLGAHEITGYEALLRWQHPKEGVVGPDGVHPVGGRVGTDHSAREMGPRGGVQVRDGLARGDGSRNPYVRERVRAPAAARRLRERRGEGARAVRVPGAVLDARTDRERAARDRGRHGEAARRAQVSRYRTCTR